MLLTAAHVVEAGRPLVTDDAGAVLPGHLEVEFGISQSRPNGGGREQAWPVISIGYGLVQNLEMGLAVQRVNNDRRADPPTQGFEDLHFTTKLRIVEERERLPGVAVSLDVKIPTAEESRNLSTGKFEEAVTLILSKAYAPLALHVNVGYLVVDSPRHAKLKNRVRAGIAAEYGITPELVLIAEVFGASRRAQAEQNEPAFHLGFRHWISSTVALDAAAGRSFRSSGASFHGTAGFTWTIDVPTLLNLRN